MTDKPIIEMEVHDTHGRYLVRMQSGEVAEMTWVVRASGIREFNHTYVPDAFRGTGIAAELMAHAIADARTQGFRIVPSCSYVATQFRRHPEWADLKA
jgi:uncharacterized protein